MTSTASRPSTARQHTRSTKSKKVDELDQGIAFTDTDGTRVQVRIRDVKGVHDAALVEVIGRDFMGLLNALQARQGLDLMAAVVWFGRLVNGRAGESYADLLETFGYEDIVSLDPGTPKAEDDSPEA